MDSNEHKQKLFSEGNGGHDKLTEVLKRRDIKEVDDLASKIKNKELRIQEDTEKRIEEELKNNESYQRVNADHATVYIEAVNDARRDIAEELRQHFIKEHRQLLMQVINPVCDRLIANRKAE